MKRINYKSKKGKRKAGPGRSVGSFKYRNPLTGQPVDSKTYKKVMKEMKNRAKIMEDQAEIRQRITMARKGLSPEEIQQTEILRAQRFAQMRQTQQRIHQRVPIQVPMQSQPQYRVVTDIMTGRKILKPIPQKERWAR